MEAKPNLIEFVFLRLDLFLKTGFRFFSLEISPDLTGGWPSGKPKIPVFSELLIL
jgi:hypothetical protein